MKTLTEVQEQCEKACNMRGDKLIAINANEAKDYYILADRGNEYAVWRVLFTVDGVPYFEYGIYKKSLADIAILFEERLGLR